MYGAFNYPIESVILHQVVNKEITSKALSESDYDVPEKVQNLYFTRPVAELMDDSDSNYDGEAEVYYICEIKFAKIISDDGHLSEEDRRNLLAQATMYPILDYFDQYVFAATTGKMIGEIAYTEVLTLQSTSRSALVVMAAGTLASIYQGVSKGASEASALIGSSLSVTTAAKATSLWNTLAVQVATVGVKVVAQTIGEMFEEIVVDGFIEAYFENSARMLGWTAGVGQLISTLMTTVRETKMFGAFNLGGQNVGTQGGITFDVNIMAQIEQDLQHASLTAQLSQLIAERESDQGFTLEKFLRENRKEVRSIMSDLDLVPSRHETILKMAGIIGSGVFAGLSLLVPGLNFAGFSLYGFNPMIKHLGQKVLSPKAGTTTIMRAAIKNARQDMLSKDVKIDNKLSGVKKDIELSAELRSRSDEGAAVRSVNGISSSGQAVEYLVNTKVEDFDADIYYALDAQSFSKTFYDPSLIVENLEVQIELLKNRMKTIELLSKAKEISSNLEQKMSVNAKKVSIVIESDTLMPQSVSGNGLRVWVHMVGSPNEKLVYIPSGANAEEINFEIRRQLELSRDTPELRISFDRDGELINLANEPNIIIDDIVRITERLKVVSEMAMWGDRSSTYGIDDSELSILEQLTTNDRDILLLRSFESNCRLTIKNYEVNFFDVFYRDDGEKTIKFVRLLDQLVSQILKDFQVDDLSFVEHYISTIWERVGKDLGASTDQMILLKTEASKLFKEEIFDVFNSDPSGSKEHIKRALTINILKLLFNNKNAEGKIIHILSDPDKIFEGIYNKLNQWITIPNQPKLGPLYSFSVVSCLVHIFGSAHGKSFYYPRRIDRGIDLEVYSILYIIPQLLIANLDGGYKYIYNIDIKKYDASLKLVLNKISGPWDHFVTNERNEYDVFGRKFSISDENKVLISSLPSKNFQESETESRVFGELALDIFRNIFETTMDIAEKYRMIDVINEIISIAPQLNNLKLDEFTEKTMYYLEKYSEILGISGRKCSKSFTFKIEKLKTINSKIWSIIDAGGASSATTRYELDFKAFKELFVSEFEGDKNAPPKEEINSYFSKIFDSHGIVRSGLILEDSIDTYYPSNERMNLNKIPISIIEESNLQEGVDYDKDGNLIGSHSLAFTLRKDSSGNIEIVHRLLRLESMDAGRLMRGEVFLDGEYWQIGVIKHVLGDNYKIFKNGMITDVTGYALKGRFGFENKNLKDFTSDWYKKHEKTYMKDKNGDKYGVKILCFRTTRFGNDYRMIRAETHLTTMQLKFGIELSFPPLMFENMKSFPRSRIEDIITMDTFENLNFETSPNRLKIIEDAKAFMSNIYSLINFHMYAYQTHSFLPIDSKVLEYLGTYEDVNSEIILGPNYQELESIFERFIGPNFRNSKYYDNYDNLVYKICSMDIISNQKNSIFGMKLRSPEKQTRKQWFMEILSLFKNYNPPSDPTSSKIDKRIYDTIVGLYDKFDKQGFSTESDKYFTPEDLILAEKVKDACEKVFGRYAFQKMYSGQIFAKDGNIRFTIPPWRTFRNTAVSRGLSLINRDGLPERDLSNHYRRGTIYRVYKTYLDFLTSAYRIQLPVDPKLEIDEEFTFIDVLGVPAQLTHPRLSEPSGTIDSNFKMFKTFYQGLSQILFDDFAPLSEEAIARQKAKGRQKVLEILIKLYNEQIANSYKKFIKYYHLAPHQIDLYEGLGISALFDYSLTSDSSHALNFRRGIYDFVTSRGELSPTLVFKSKKFPSSMEVFNYILQFTELRLTKDVLKLFEQNYNEIIYGFNPIAILSTRDNELHAESVLRSNQDLVLDFLDFVKDIAKDSSEKIILYTYNRFAKGFGIDSIGAYLPSVKPSVDNVWTGEKTERYYVIDPSKLQDADKDIPNILGSVFVDDQILVIRTSNMPEDQCLFAFSLRTGSIMPYYLYHEEARYTRPSADGLTWSDESKYTELYNKFNLLLRKHNFFGMRRIQDANTFYQVCRLIRFIDDYSFNG